MNIEKQVWNKYKISHKTSNKLKKYSSYDLFSLFSLEFFLKTLYIHPNIHKDMPIRFLDLNIHNNKQFHEFRYISWYIQYSNLIVINSKNIVFLLLNTKRNILISWILSIWWQKTSIAPVRRDEIGISLCKVGCMSV